MGNGLDHDDRLGVRSIEAPGDEEEDTLRSLGIREGEVLAGKYRVVRVLGQGAMGIVISAIHLALEEPVALKLLSPSALGASAAARFQREARAVARIRSEHVARVMDVGTLEGGAPFIVMEHLHGVDLAQAIRSRGRSSIVDAVDCIVQACDALAEAHALGIVHRDLKPSNLFLAQQRDGSTLLKVLDFGVSKLTKAGAPDSRLTLATALVGSPHYMSPEQIESPRDVDARADVWSLGVILYELVAGARPFDAASREVLFLQISTSQPRPLREIRPDISTAFEAAVNGCLQKDPSRRTANVGVLARCLASLGGPRSALLVERITRILEPAPDTTAPTSRVAPPDDAPARGGTEDLQASEPAFDTAGAGSWSSSSGEDALIGSRLGGKFRLLAVLGRGGMGVVYEAQDETGTRVAVKVIRPELAREPVARERLLRESEIARRVVSDNVVRLLEAGIDEPSGAPFLVMDLLNGEDLAATLQRVGPLDPAAVARIFSQVCRGLSDAHASGLVHRDIKPANIFLHRARGGAVTVKLCDFGIAKSTLVDGRDRSDQALTTTGTMVGSPIYMSPEQARNARSVDERTDVWSASLSMYEALAGQQPWASCTAPGELILAICTQDIAPLHKIAPWLDRRLADVVHRGLRRDVVERWRNAKELEAALRPFIGEVDALADGTLAGIDRDRRASTPRPDLFPRFKRIGLVGVAGALVSLAFILRGDGHLSSAPLTTTTAAIRAEEQRASIGVIASSSSQDLTRPPASAALSASAGAEHATPSAAAPASSGAPSPARPPAAALSSQPGMSPAEAGSKSPVPRPRAEPKRTLD